jgi:hypothetical protein
MIGRSQISFRAALVVLSLAFGLIGSATASAQSVVKQFQFAGVTSSTHTGNIGGPSGVLAACRVKFPASRMCSASEIIRTMNWPAGNFFTAWVTNVNPNALGRGRDPGDGSVLFDDPSVEETCDGWSSNSGYAGTTFNFSYMADSSAGCSSNPRPIACCQLLPVPEPPTSLMLPAGAGALIVVSWLRGVSFTP